MEFDGIVCFACGDWWYHNRGHFDMQLMRRFRRELPILYVNSMGLKFPSFKEGGHFFRRIRRKLGSVRKWLVQDSPNFLVFSPFSVPLYSRPRLRKLNAWSVRMQFRHALHRSGIRRPLAWVVSPPAFDLVKKLKLSGLVYQRTDDFKEFDGGNRSAIAEMDEGLIRMADLVIHVNRTLHEESIALGARSLLVSHGVDFDLFSPEGRGGEPQDMIEVPHPRIGFYGGIDNHTFDLPFYLKVVDLLPDFHFVLVGACSLDKAPLQLRKNVHLLGQKPYEEIPAYGRSFDVA